MVATVDATMPSRSDDGNKLRIFVTVGTTRFDTLIRAVLSNEFLDSIAELSQDGAQVVVQYGNSSIADILTSSALASVDQGSEIVPEAGMRIINGRRVYQTGTNIPGLDPGQTGTITGLRLRATGGGSFDGTSSSSDPKSAGAGLFDRILNEAKATAGLAGNSASSSALQGAALEAVTEAGVELKLFQFAPELKCYIGTADIVISHAGSGTILDTLRMQPKTPALVVVPNTSLMDNHQVELAEALAKDNFLVVGSQGSLAKHVARARTTTCVKFPDFDPTRFTGIVDQVMGM